MNAQHDPAFEICYFPMPDTFIRVRGGNHGIFGTMRQITYRCGRCGTPVGEDHLISHWVMHSDEIRHRVTDKDRDNK